MRSGQRTSWSERRRDLVFAVGVLLALGGSYVAINEAFRDHTVCTSQLGCFEVRNPEDIWVGLVACVLGVVMVVANYRRRPDT